MNGLEVAEGYFEAEGAPMLQEKFPAYVDRIAAGLVGDGSECFGFDDEMSRDHDWGPGFCLWLNTQDHEAIGKSLQREVTALSGEFAGFRREMSRWGSDRTGVFEIGEFYKRFIGFDHVPDRLSEWRVIPESFLAVATNGRVFVDPTGEFTSFRNELKKFYPEDIRLKKMSARCMGLAQSGQYNYMRCARRGEYVAARLAEAKFVEDAISMVFLLNKEYKPFYKWMHRAMTNLPILGDTMSALVSQIVNPNEDELGNRKCHTVNGYIEATCQCIIRELKGQGLSDSDSDFLLDHGMSIQGRIQDPSIRSLNVWIE